MKCTSVFLLGQEKEESRQKSIPSTPGKQERERPQRPELEGLEGRAQVWETDTQCASTYTRSGVHSWDGGHRHQDQHLVEIKAALHLPATHP